MEVNSIIFVAVVALLLYKAINLLRNIRLARATGLPFVTTPMLETEAFALLTTPILRWYYHDYLDKGQGWPRWCRFIVKDWAWEDKRIAHDELGDVFLCVSPEGIICYTADAAMGWDVMNRRNDFTKPRDKYKILEPYGPNVATAEGKTYRFHVRFTAPPFGDGSGANELVWNETLYQSQRLAQAWSQEKPRNLQVDVNSLTLAVIALAGFGKRIEWTTTAHEDVQEGYKVSFLKAISETTNNMVAILMFPRWLLSWSPWSEVALAHAQLEKYMREMIRSETKNIKADRTHESKSTKGNLLTAVLQASVMDSEANRKDEPKGSRKEAFTEDEVMGNLFVYLLAGYETTANAIAYGLITLALEPTVQDKIMQEVTRVWAEAEATGRAELSYSKDFEKLEYLYGFMYETFRLFPGVTLITKVATTPQNIVASAPGSEETRSYLLPAGTRVYLTAPSIHYHPKYWPDPYVLEPNRWNLVREAGKAVEKAGERKVTAADRTRQMRGTLLTFSDGARACLGRKFAQAEYMAFFAQLLKEYRVVLAPGLDADLVKRDLYMKCAGKLTLAPLDYIKVTLERKPKGVSDQATES